MFLSITLPPNQMPPEPFDIVGSWVLLLAVLAMVPSLGQRVRGCGIAHESRSER